MKKLLCFLLCVVCLTACQTPLPTSPGTPPSQDSVTPPSTQTTPPALDEPVNRPTDTPTEPTDRGEFTLTLCGDVFLGKEFAAAEESNGKGYAFKYVAPYFLESDLTLVNLETSVTERGETKKRPGYCFRTPASTLSVLTDAGIDAVSIANNHIFDYGEIGLFDTFDALENADIPYTGAGKNISDAAKTVFLSANGYRIGFLAFDQCIPWKSWSATEEKPGVATFTRDDAEHLISRVKETEKECDYLVVSLHWGTEYTSVCSSWQRTLAHELVDAGADVIYGHHPHVLQGIEIYKDRPILYSCGNFLFYKKNDDAGQTAFFTLTFDEEGLVKGEFTPVYITRMQSTLPKEGSERYENVVDILETQSKKLGNTIDRENRRFYQR